MEKLDNKLRVFEAFSGYGSQSMSLRDINEDYDVVGISEVEPDAIIAYGAIRYNIEDLHTNKTHDEMREELIAKNIGKDFKTGKSKIPRMKKDKLEMLYKFDKAINNFGDISIIDPNDLPDFDYFTYSFPCQDISVAGKQEGINKNTRSGLLYECEKIIENKRPKYLLMENVKNLVGKKFRQQFDEWCEYLTDLGYTNYHNNYKCLNAKDFELAQNRERIFMISVFGEHDEIEFPEGVKLTKTLKDFLEDEVDEKYYLSEERVCKIYNWKAYQRPLERVLGKNSIIPTLTARGGGEWHSGMIILGEKFENTTNVDRIIREQRCDEGLRFFKDNVCGAIRTINSGGDKRVIEIEPNFRIRRLTPRECLRLQGVSDRDIDKMISIGLSDSSLYKLAGNSIAKNVLDALHINMFKSKGIRKLSKNEKLRLFGVEI